MLALERLEGVAKDRARVLQPVVRRDARQHSREPRSRRDLLQDSGDRLRGLLRLGH